MSYRLGELISFTGHFENAAGADTDPTTVKFFMREELDGTELEWTYNASPTAGTHYPVGMNPVVKDSTGDYSVLYATRKAERLTVHWSFTNSTAVYVTVNMNHAFVRHAGINLVEP